MNGVSKWRTSAGRQHEEGGRGGGGEGMHFTVNENNWPLVSSPLRGSGLCTPTPPCAATWGFLGNMVSATPQLNYANGYAAGSPFSRSPTPSATAECGGARQYKSTRRM